ncbi:MAG: L-seryl-tRNA(Sec) selenium transferase [Acidobacteria bacterium]|nr:L-seryl-tRNA(Sec) selenium transferase [Acidobacteriota bacterium]
MQEKLRRIPAVDQLLGHPRVAGWVRKTSRGFVVSEIQVLLESIREAIRNAHAPAVPPVDPESLAQQLETQLSLRLRPTLRPVINATGVVLHTNLGRAPLSAAAQESLSAVSAQYTNLEFDLETGERSHRDKLIESSLKEVLGAEAAAVVNNNAAAIFLILNTLGAGREVIVSRGELVEIGGSFRIPDIMARSGAVLREVGTTNKTRIQDYEAAIGLETALLLRIHPSNYRIRGFTHRPALEELVELARRRQLPLVEDVGSGCLVDLRPFGIREEPLPQESLRAGVDLVCFSADKLLGGPQAGVIAGLRKWVDPVRKNPLMRTFRVEKLIYGALQATLASYRTGRAMEEIPVLRMLSMSRDEIAARSDAFIEKLGPCLPADSSLEIVDGISVVGGGSCPESQLPTRLITVRSGKTSAGRLEQSLRSQDPPIILRIEEDRAVIDLRTVFTHQEETLLAGLRRVLE